MAETWTARLDAEGVLTGFDETGATEGIEVPAGCDLAPGKYRWNAETQRFEPILERFLKPKLQGDPDSLVAIALGLRALARATGTTLPDYTQLWLQGFARYPDTLQQD